MVTALDVSVDEGVVALSAYPGVPVPDVHGIAQQTLPVGADIEHHRDHARRVDSARRGVDRQLADRHLDAAHAPIADSQDLLGVGREDQVDIAGAGAEIGKRLLDGFRHGRSRDTRLADAGTHDGIAPSPCRPSDR